MELCFIRRHKDSSVFSTELFWDASVSVSVWLIVPGILISQKIATDLYSEGCIVQIKYDDDDDDDEPEESVEVSRSR